MLNEIKHTCSHKRTKKYHTLIKLRKLTQSKSNNITVRQEDFTFGNNSESTMKTSR